MLSGCLPFIYFKLKLWKKRESTTKQEGYDGLWCIHKYLLVYKRSNFHPIPRLYEANYAVSLCIIDTRTVICTYPPMIDNFQSRQCTHIFGLIFKGLNLPVDSSKKGKITRCIR